MLLNPDWVPTYGNDRHERETHTPFLDTHIDGPARLPSPPRLSPPSLSPSKRREAQELGDELERLLGLS